MPISLSENEYRLLSSLRKGEEIDVETLARRTGLPVSTIMAVAELLRSRGLVRMEKRVVLRCVLSREGEKALSEGLPEEKLYRLLLETGESTIRDLVEKLGKKEFSIALGWLRKMGVVRVEGGVVRLVTEKWSPPHRRLLELCGKKPIMPGSREEKEYRILESRGLVRLEEDKRIYIKSEEDPREILSKALVEVSRLTPEMLADGSWRIYRFRRYNVAAEPPRIYPGKKHFYAMFLERIRRVLYEMGFTEAEGPYIETEFWNFDVLFQAQDHPAREVHDTFWVKGGRGRLPSNGIVERVGKIHENGGETGSTGWGYKWDPSIAARLVLRTQTTAVSARVLASHPKPPLRVFTIGKVFRPDVVDAKHLPEFYQLDGIVMEEDMSFAKLLGVLKELFERLGISELKFKPGYFPFTEPSVEGYIYIEGRGWVEVFGAGMFRPEVLAAVGVEYPVGAWGIGLDRVAMDIMGLDDIRKLYTRDLGLLRTMPLRW